MDGGALRRQSATELGDNVPITLSPTLSLV
jgi:hypothetical protein